MDGNHKSSLERLTSPEQLNERLKVVGVPSWIAILVIGIIVAAILLWSFLGSIPVIAEGRGVVFDPSRTLLIRSDIKGAISHVYVEPGDSVEQGTLLIELKNPEKEKEQIASPAKGEIVNISIFAEGEVNPGGTLVWMTLPKSGNQTQKIYAVFPLQSGEKIKENMSVELQLASVDRNQYGLLLATVTKVFPYFTSFEQGPLAQLPSKDLLDYLISGLKGGVIIEIEPKSDPNTFTGYKWSTQNGPPFEIKEGTFCNVIVVYEIRKPISFLIRR